MRIDLHIHSRVSDGKMTVEEIFQEAHRRKINLLSITDHDSLDSQETALRLAKQYKIHYLCGIELNVAYSSKNYTKGKTISLDFLGYHYDVHFRPLVEKLRELRKYREKRAEIILHNLNLELIKEKIEPLTANDLRQIQEMVDGSFGRPHIADYLIKRGIVDNKQEAFDKYLVKCNVPKMPLSLTEASSLIREAGGILVFAHPAHPRGTSLTSITHSIENQQQIIRADILPFIDGIECWHSSYDEETTKSYLRFAEDQGLRVTGGSDCHQQPIMMGTVDVPDFVAEQFEFITNQ